MVHAGLGRIEQLDEVGLGPGDGDAVLLGQGLELLHAQSVQVADLSALESCLELCVFRRLGLRLLFDALGRDDARGGFSRRFRPQLSSADHQGPRDHARAATVGMGRLLGKAVRVEHLAVQRSADRANPLVLHGHPFELPDSDLVVELESPLVMGAQDLRAGDHLHAVLGLGEHLGTGITEGFRVFHHAPEVADDVLHALTGGDATHHDAFDAVGQLAVDVAGQDQVVIGHEIEGICVHQGEHSGGELVDTFRGQVTVEGKLGRGEFVDASVDALAEGCFGRLPEKQRLLPV